MTCACPFLGAGRTVVTRRLSIPCCGATFLLGKLVNELLSYGGHSYSMLAPYWVLIPSVSLCPSTLQFLSERTGPVVTAQHVCCMQPVWLAEHQCWRS
jgi:hypothetical protein